VGYSKKRANDKHSSLLCLNVSDWGKSFIALTPSPLVAANCQNFSNEAITNLQKPRL
jgi:hypothetical protein